MKVDTIYTNGNIYTVNQGQPWATAFAVKDGKFVKVGTDSEITALAEEGTEKVDLQGQFILPGLIETHVHPVRVIMFEDMQFRNNNLIQRTPDEFGQILKKYADEHPEKEWIYGAGYSWAYFDQTGIKPDRHFLDKYVSDRPVVIEDDGGHVVSVNTKALAVAGVTKDTPNPYGGSIDRDENGDATGILYASPAIKIVLRHYPRTPLKNVLTSAEKASKIITSFGYTGIKIMEGDRTQMEAYKQLDEEGKLKMDVAMHPYLEDFYLGYQNDEALKDRAKYETEHFKVTGVKLFIDSTPYGHAVAVKHHYKTSDQDFGTTIVPYEQYRDEMVYWNGLGFSVATHTMGDRGLSLEVDAMEESAKVNGLEKVRALRNQIAHSMMIDPADLKRIRRVGAFTEFSPNVALGLKLVDTLRDDMEKADLDRLWPMADAVNAGVNYTIASDWIQAPMNPFLHIEQAMTRRPAGGEKTATQKFGLDQTISLPAAIDGYTINAARLAFTEDKAGSIEAGKNANFIILNKNVFDVPVNQIHTLFAKKVFFEGELVHENAKQVDRD